jgi:hypothetical protein
VNEGRQSSHVIGQLLALVAQGLKLGLGGRIGDCEPSDWELTDTYSPAAMDIAPATNPAIPATNTLL